MGYSTWFTGQFTFNKPLPQEVVDEILLLEKYEVSTQRTLGGGFARLLGSRGEPCYECDWRLTRRLDGLMHNGAEKSYAWYEWLCWINDALLKPCGCHLVGQVGYQGDNRDDFGTIYADENGVRRVAVVVIKSPEVFVEECLAAVEVFAADVDREMKLEALREVVNRYVPET